MGNTSCFQSTVGTKRRALLVTKQMHTRVKNVMFLQLNPS